MSDEPDKELKLRVAKAIPSDVGHGRARVPFDNELNHILKYREQIIRMELFYI